MQYPPGTGFSLALFPAGFQVIPLYLTANVIVFGFALLGIFYARSRSSVVLAAGFGGLAIYLMINPDQGELLDGTDHDDVRGRGLFYCKIVSCRSIRNRAPAVRAGRPADRTGGEFQAAQSVSRFRIFSVFRGSFVRYPKRERSCKRASFGAACLVGHGADAARECDQCRQSFDDHLWKRRRPHRPSSASA